MSVFQGMNQSFANAARASQTGPAPSGVSLGGPIVNRPITSATPNINLTLQPASNNSTGGSGGIFQSLMSGIVNQMSTPEGFGQAAGMLRPIAEPILRYGGLPALMAIYGRTSGNDMLSALMNKTSRFVAKPSVLLVSIALRRANPAIKM